MAAKKSKSDNYLTVLNLRELADAMMVLEEKSLKKWSKKPAVKRGEDLQALLEDKFPGIGDEVFRVAMWVDLYLYTRDILTDSDYYFTLMDIDEAIPVLIKYANEHPDQFESIFEWVRDFGCLLTEGSGSDIGAWFHDWFFEPLFEVEALADKEYLFLDNPTKAQLAKLAKSASVRDRVQAALQSESDAELLKTLSKDSATAVRQAAAMNPSTPEKALDALSRDPEKLVREAALMNESISIDSIESSDSESGSLSLASSKKATAETLAKLAKEKDEEVRAAVAANENTSPETLSLLAKDKSDDVRENVADNPNCTMEIIKILVRDKNYLIRGGLAMRDDLTEELQKILSKDKERWVREMLAENKSTPHEILLTLSKDLDSYVRDLALKNANLRDGSVEKFENPDSVKLAIAGNTSTPADILESFSTNAEPIYYQGKTSSLMMAVAGNASIPESVMEKLIKSKNKEVLKELAANHSLSANYLKELVEASLKKLKAGKSDWSDRDLELGLASNPNSPASYLTALLKHNDSWVVAAVAENPNLPPDKLAKLAKSNHSNIRKGVAANPKAPWVLLQSLLGDDECKWQLAQNPAMRGNDLAELALQKTAGPNLLADIAMNPSLSSDQIEKLAKHKDVWVRLGIARNTNTPQEIRKGILEGFLKLKSEENEGDRYLIRCELTPPEMIDEVLERYLPLESTNREDRLSYIARNPNTRPETLAKLAGDRFTEVRIAVSKNPNTPVETLRQLSR
jgi:pentose-5-phosphate-3-epimerase